MQQMLACVYVTIVQLSQFKLFFQHWVVKKINIINKMNLDLRTKVIQIQILYFQSVDSTKLNSIFFVSGFTQFTR